MLKSGEREDAGDGSHRVRREALEAGVDGERDRDDPERELDDDREPGEAPAATTTGLPRVGRAPVPEQQPERGEPEGRRQDVGEEQGGEREHERPDPEEDRRGRAVLGDDPLRGAPDEQQEEERGERRAEDRDLPRRPPR